MIKCANWIFGERNRQWVYKTRHVRQQSRQRSSQKWEKSKTQWGGQQQQGCQYYSRCCRPQASSRRLKVGSQTPRTTLRATRPWSLPPLFRRRRPRRHLLLAAAMTSGRNTRRSTRLTRCISHKSPLGGSMIAVEVTAFVVYSSLASFKRLTFTTVFVSFRFRDVF